MNFILQFGEENQTSFKNLVVNAVNIEFFNNTMDGCIFESISLEVKLVYLNISIILKLL